MFVSVMFLSFAVIDINTVNAGKKSDKKPCLNRGGGFCFYGRYLKS